MSGAEAAMALAAIASTAVTIANQPDAPPMPMAAKAMPTPDDDMARAARKKSIAEQMQLGGRASTILSDKSGDFAGLSNKLGG